MNDLTHSKPSQGNWVQTERSAHEAWALLIAKAPKAAALMHLLTARVGENNAVVVSHKNLARLLEVKSTTTVKAAIKVLREDNWIEVQKVGSAGAVNAYVINDKVAWAGKRDGIRYSLFTASVITSDDDQDEMTLSQQATPLRRVLSMEPGEQQLPSGDGLPPPSEPTLPGMEPELPARRVEEVSQGVTPETEEPT